MGAITTRSGTVILGEGRVRSVSPSLKCATEERIGVRGPIWRCRLGSTDHDVQPVGQQDVVPSDRRDLRVQRHARERAVVRDRDAVIRCRGPVAVPATKSTA